MDFSMQNVKFNYDRENDILYISINGPKPSYSEEEIPGIIIRRDFETDVVNGITILDFCRRLNDNSLSNIPLPIKVDFSQVPIHC